MFNLNATKMSHKVKLNSDSESLKTDEEHIGLEQSSTNCAFS